MFSTSYTTSLSIKMSMQQNDTKIISGALVENVTFKKVIIEDN